MPKEHPKQVRNCTNETQVRDPKTGRFFMRRDDCDVTHSVSLSEMYREGVARVREFYAEAKRRRIARHPQRLAA